MENEIVKHEPKQPTVSDYSSMQRKKWVLDQYLLGRYPYQIREEYQATYQLSTGSYDKDVEWANIQLRKKGELEVEEVISKHIDMYYDIYRDSREHHDNKAALSALKHIEDLLKIHGSKASTGNVTFNTQNNTVKLPNSLSVDEIRELLRGDTSTETIVIS